jgi:cytochrome P450
VTSENGHAPGPRGKPILGSLPDFRRDIMQAFIDGWRAFGDVVHFRGPLSVYLVAHPDDINDILYEHAGKYRHPKYEIDKLKPTFGEGLVLSQGEVWRRQRELTQPALHRDRIARFSTMITDSTEEMLDRWKGEHAGGRAIDARSEFQRLTVRVLAKALFSADVLAEAETIGELVTVSNEHTNRRLLAPVNLPEWIPLPSQRRFVEARDKMDEIIYRIIRERRRADAQKRDDLLSMLLEARDESGQGMTDLQLHDEIVTLFIAGHETVSLCLTWASFLLSRNPDVRQRLRDELAEVLDGRTPTLEDIPRLELTTRILFESLRLYPPIWVIPREPLEDVTIGGYDVPAGSMIFIVGYITHRHRDFWPNPEGFEPDRFLRERSADRPRTAFIPFGGGPRQCIGFPFAMMEMQLILAMVNQAFELNLSPGHPIALEPMITLRPRHGMLMTVDAPGGGRREPQVGNRGHDAARAGG